METVQVEIAREIERVHDEAYGGGLSNINVQVADDIVVVSPDEGSIKRALGHAKRLGSRLSIVDKRRSSAETTRQENMIGASVDGKRILEVAAGFEPAK